MTYSAGIGGETPSILTIVDSVQVGRAEDNFIPTEIVASLTDSFDGLIGMDFMANYTIRIDATKHGLFSRRSLTGKTCREVMTRYGGEATS
jgi:hypothetical protein